MLAARSTLLSVGARNRPGRLGREAIELSSKGRAFRDSATQRPAISGSSAQAARDHLLGDLHGVRRSTLAQVVAHLPEPQPIAREIAAHAADENLVAACDVAWRGEGVPSGIVHDGN